MQIKVDLRDLGWVMVQVGEKWFPAHALQNCFDGVSFMDWEAAARQLRQRYKAEASVHEETVARALCKIREINDAEQKRVGVFLDEVTPAGLERGKEDLFLGLTIKPDDPSGFDFPPEDDLFGHVVPKPKSDGGAGGAVFDADPQENGNIVADPEVWRFDDD